MFWIWSAESSLRFWILGRGACQRSKNPKAVPGHRTPNPKTPSLRFGLTTKIDIYISADIDSYRPRARKLVDGVARTIVRGRCPPWCNVGTNSGQGTGA